MTIGFGVHRRHVGAELREDGFAHAGLGGDDGEDVDHGCWLPMVWRHPTADRRVRQAMAAA
jgi:hypothetical protein